MPSLMELVERVNKGEMVDAETLEMYQESPNSAEKFLAHHANATLDLRRAHQHMLQSLEAIDYSDQKVLNQFIAVSGFIGQTDLRCGPIVKFGACAIARREYGLGLEAIQNAAAYDLMHNGAFTADRDNCLFIATQYERAAAGVGWSSPQPTEAPGKQMRIAYVVSSLGDDEQATRTACGMARQYDSKRFKFSVYSTESGVRRERMQFVQGTFVASSAKRGKEAMEQLNKLKVSCYCAPTDCDTVSAAKSLAEQLVKDRVDVVLFDCTQADAIAALCAQWDVARVKINLCRRSPMFMSGLPNVCYFDQGMFENYKEFWNRRGVECKYILEGMDLDETAGAPPQRGAYGIPDSSVVLATCGSELDRTMSDEFVETVVNILRAHPQAIFLCIGEGDQGAQRRRFEAAGVAKRVGYTGKRKDLPSFLRIADIYLAEFPSSAATGVLQAMSVERPVVAMRWGEAPEQSAAAAFCGSECTVSGRDSNAYVERVSKLIREPATRSKLGKSMRQRVEQNFALSQTARHLEQWCEQLLQQRPDSAGSIGRDEPQTPPIAQVA